MSTVGSDYVSHTRPIDELEKDYETARKKAKERDETREAKLDQNFKRSVTRIEEKSNDAVKDIRDKFERSSTRSREIDRAQRDELKKDLYDRAGRRVANAVSEAEEERDRVQSTLDETTRKYQKANSGVEDYYAKQAEERQADADRRVEEIQQNYKEALEKAEKNAGGHEDQKLSEYKQKLQREAQEAIADAQAQVSEARRKTLDTAEAFEREAAVTERKNEHHLNSRLESQGHRHALEMEDNARYERASRVAETSELRNELSELSRAKAENQKDYGRGRQQAIDELESEWRGDMRHLQESHDSEYAHLKETSAQAEDNMGARHSEALRSQADRLSRVITQQNLDHSKQMADAVTGYDRAKKQIETQAQKTVELSDHAHTQQQNQLVQAKNEALDRQARTYQDAMRRQKTQDHSQIQNLERILRNQNSTDDPGQISAAAEAAIRNQMQAKYEKTFNAEADRNREQIDRLARGYRKDMEDERGNHDFETVKLNQQALLEKQRTQDEFVNSIQELQESKIRQAQVMNDQQEKSRDSMTQLSERGMTEMRRHYEDLLEQRGLDANYQINTLRQTSEFEKKNMRREFQAQTNELIRGYEKQLGEQKTQYEDQLRELKARTDAQARDNEKRLRQALEQADKSYKQRLAETESQHRERERLISERNEDELDKVKRSNALLLSKKG